MLEETAVGVSKGDGADVAEHSAPTWTNRHIGVGKPAELDTQQIPSTDGAPGPMTPLNSDVAAPLIDSRSSSLRGCQTGASLSNGALLPPGSEPELQDAIRDSPFLDLSSPMTPYEWLKIPIMVPAVLVRLCITIVCLPLVWVVISLVILGVGPNDPVLGWRKAIIRPFLKFWARVLLHIGFNFWPRVKGYENFEAAHEVQATMIFNHVSYTDGIVLGAYFLPCGVAKASVADIPFFGTFTKACSFLFISRKGSGDKAKTAEVLKGHATQAVHERAADPRYPLLTLAPEGTCKHPNCLLTFSTGAFVGGRPVLPVLLHYRARHFNVGWGRVANTLWHFVRLQTQFINHLDVEVLPAYTPSSEEAEDPRLYAENVRRLMADRLGAQLSSHGLREQQALKRAGICVDWLGRRIIRQGRKGGAKKTTS